MPDGVAERSWTTVDTNLRAGKVRPVFVADVILRELRRVRFREETGIEFSADRMTGRPKVALEALTPASVAAVVSIYERFVEGVTSGG